MFRALLRLTSKILLLIFLLSFTSGDRINPYTIPRAALSVFACDLHNSGNLDLLAGHRISWQDTISPTLTILSNQNDGTFEIADTSKKFCGYQENIFAVDLNADGFSDIVALSADFSTGQARHFIRVYYSEEGTFQRFTEYGLNTSSTINYLNYGDVNGDGKMDLLFTSEVGHFWGILYNQGNEVFVTPQYFSLGSNMPWKIVCVDLNNDGRDDVVLCGQRTEVFFSYPDSFKHVVLSTGFASDCWVADLDNDGNNDIVTNSDGSPWNSHLDIYQNMGDDSIVMQSEIVFPTTYSKLFIADFNNDNLRDLLLLKGDNTGYDLYFNHANFSFQDSLNIIIPKVPDEWLRNCYCADLDKNGYVDIVTVRTSYIKIPNIEISYNDGKGHFINQPLGFPGGSRVEKNTWFRNYPNPFTSHTVITFNLISPTNIELSIYDMTGKFITCLLNKRVGAGTNNFIWDCSDFSGKKCSPGAYFAVLKIQGDESKSIKLLITN